MSSLLHASFVAAAAALWLSVFGYVGALVALAMRHRGLGRGEAPPVETDALPAIAVVVPVRNEEGFITAKLDDLRRCHYPAERLRTVIVDGGSTDRTPELVGAARARGAAVELVRVDDARGKAEQLNAVLPRLCEPIAVVTDVDTALDPVCIRRLVEALLADPNAVIVGAGIRPATRLLEERIHWWLLNSLWWLEGEALGAGAISGVCYAMRRDVCTRTPLPPDCTAEDIRLGLLATAAGGAVRLCRRARATELRVPQTAAEFLSFRRRRGRGYIRELLRARPDGAPLRWRALRLARLYHFFVMPLLAIAVVTGALALCALGQWQAPAAVALAFAIPAAIALSASTTLGAENRRWWRLSLAAGRLAGLTWLSLLALPRAARPTFMQGDS